MNEAAEFVNNTRAIRTAINESKKKRRRSSSNGGSSSNKTPPKEKKVKSLIKDALRNSSRGLTSVNDKKTGTFVGKMNDAINTFDDSRLKEKCFIICLNISIYLASE